MLSNNLKVLELKVAEESASLKTTMIEEFTEILLELSAGVIEIKLGLVVSAEDSSSELVELSAESPLEEETVVNFQLLSCPRLFPDVS
jgi:hypothetical protein|tara:strand:- start:90 stop:353 length:264 start_codon:yes stop_codon:yes gene_type:complete